MLTILNTAGAVALLLFAVATTNFSPVDDNALEFAEKLMCSFFSFNESFSTRTHLRFPSFHFHRKVLKVI